MMITFKYVRAFVTETGELTVRFHKAGKRPESLMYDGNVADWTDQEVIDEVTGMLGCSDDDVDVIFG